MPDTAPILAIDTATNQLALALFWPHNQRSKQLIEPAARGGERLHCAIAELLDKGNLTLHNLGGIVVAIGPGSFTGIRVGIAAAQGLADVLQIPTIGISNMVAQAQPHVPITLWNEAHGGQVYVQTFDKNTPAGSVQSLFVDAAAKKLQGKLGGNALRTYQAQIPPDITVVPNADKADPVILAKLGYEQLRSVGNMPLKPLYIKTLTYKKLAEQGKKSTK